MAGILKFPKNAFETIDLECNKEMKYLLEMIPAQIFEISIERQSLFEKEESISWN